MALTTCPDCSKEVSDSAEHCIHCGRPMVATRAADIEEGAKQASALIALGKFSWTLAILLGLGVGLAFGFWPGIVTFALFGTVGFAVRFYG